MIALTDGPGMSSGVQMAGWGHSCALRRTLPMLGDTSRCRAAGRLPAAAATPSEADPHRVSADTTSQDACCNVPQYPQLGARPPRHCMYMLRIPRVLACHRRIKVVQVVEAQLHYVCPTGGRLGTLCNGIVHAGGCHDRADLAALRLLLRLCSLRLRLQSQGVCCTATALPQTVLLVMHVAGPLN